MHKFLVLLQALHVAIGLAGDFVEQGIGPGQVARLEGVHGALQGAADLLQQHGSNAASGVQQRRLVGFEFLL